ncbi:MAG TPA: CAP domain-containing protein [Acidimicrobiia bacterium]|nr:CAP domain-containing protein [Acidimicrobiia bacterium]
MLGKTRWLYILLVVALATFGLGASAGADSGSEQSFLSKINSSRSSAGLPPLSMDGGLQSHARKHTADMIAAGEIYHSTSAELQAAAGSGWSKLGENVGRGGSVSSLHDKFMSSSGHQANILGDYNYVGIGADTASGVLYVTVVFMKKGSTATTTTTTAPAPTTTEAPKSSPTTQSPAPKTTQAPNTTQPPTTTTIPPTTTTTLIVGPDKPVTPGESCYTATRFWWMCHD